MIPKPVAILAPLAWLVRAVNVGRRDPRAVFGALAIVIGVGFAILVVQLVLQLALQSLPVLATGVTLVVTVLGWVVLPPLFAGVFRVLDAAERGRGVAAAEVLAPLQDATLVRKLVLTVLAFTALQMLLGALLMQTSLGVFLGEYLALVQSVPPGGQPDTAAVMALLERAPVGAILAWGVVFVVWMHAYMFAIASAALSPATALQSIVAGVAAMLRNFLPLMLASLVVAIVGGLAGFMALLVIGVVSLLSAALGAVLMLALILVMPIAAYALAFAFYYHGWRETFADAPATAGIDSISV